MGTESTRRPAANPTHTHEPARSPTPLPKRIGEPYKKPAVGPGPLPKSPAKPELTRAPDEVQRLEVIRVALLNAELWAESTLAGLARDGVDHGTDWNLDEVVAPLHIALDTLQTGGELDATSVWLQLDNTSRTLAKLREALGAAGPDQHDALEQITAIDQRLRASLGRTPTPTLTSSRDRKATVESTERQLLGSLLSLIAEEAKRGYRSLVDQSDRRHEILPPVIRALSTHVDHAALLAENTAPVTALPALEAASQAILQLQNWAHAREEVGKYMPGLGRIVSSLDRIRGHAGLEKLNTLDTPALPQSESLEQEREERAVDAAKDKLFSTLKTQYEAYKEGVTLFRALSELKKPPPPTSWSDQLAKSIVIAAIGNLGGPAVGFLVASIAKGTVSKTAIDFISNTTTDASQAELDERIQKEAPGTNQDTRDRERFAAGMTLGHTKTIETLEHRIADLRHSRQVSAAELDALRVAAQHMPLGDLTQTVYRQAMHGFALFRARQALGTKQQGKQNVADLDNYFARDIHGVPEKEGSTGVGRISMRLLDHGNTLQAVVDRFDVHGMNHDMALAVMERAEYRLGRLGLPLEVEVTPPVWGKKLLDGNPFFVVDERGALHSSRGWSEITARLRSQHVQQPDNADVFLTPERAWSWLRDQIQLKSVASIPVGA